MFEVPIYAAGAVVLTAIAKAVGPEKLAEQAGSGVVGNWADRILVTGLTGAQYGWRRFRENCRRLDALENHVLFRALVAAHWSAVAQAIAVYGRARGITLSTAADSLPLPASLREAAARLASEQKPLGFLQQSERETLRAVVAACDQRARDMAVHDLPSGWDAVLEPLYDDLTTLVSQGRRPVQAPAEKAWNALAAEFPALDGDPLHAFFVDHWFEFFMVNFQARTQDPQVAPLLMGKLFAEIREREAGPLVEASRLMAALTDGFAGVHTRLDEVHADVRAIRESLERGRRVPVREPVIGLFNMHQRIVGREEEARALLNALHREGPGLVSIAAPPGFGKSAVLALALARKMPELDIEAAGLNGLAVLDARLESPTLAALASLIGRLTGWQETAARFAGASGDPARRLFFDFLRQAGRVWLVVENAERALLPEVDADFRALLKEWCAMGHSAKLLLLTRHALNPYPPGHQRLRAVEAALRKGLPPHQAAEVLRDRLQGTRFAGAADPLLRAVATRLHGVPLALVQFAGYLRANEAGLELNERFVATNDLLRLFDPDQMEESIARVIGEHVQRLDEESRRLLGLVAWAGTPVPQSGLLAVAGEGGAKRLTSLALSGLLEEVDGKAAAGRPFGMHPLVQELLTPFAAGEAEARAWWDAAKEEYDRGRMRPADTLYALAVRVFRRLVEEDGRGELANDLAIAIMNHGVALASLGWLEAAVAAYDEAIRIRRRLVEEEGRGELANDLARALYNLALARKDQGHPHALAAAREAREIWERLVAAGWAHLASALENARKLEDLG
ncbi:MAG: hypothetical protein JNN08_00900 [Bryobacterales bacterium]|nr:hypothetical protein [Bryobacterales bacterium]